jgi:type II secretory pathway component GspD/PulD (secretin)
MATTTFDSNSRRRRRHLAVLALCVVGAWTPAALCQEQPQEPPTTLDELGAPARPQHQGPASGVVEVDFKEAPLEEVIRTISLQAGINIFWDTSVAGQKVTLVMHHPVPAAANALQLTKQLDGNLYRISARAPGTGADKMPITSGKQTELEGFEQFAIHIVEVKFADVSKVAELLGTVGSQDAAINAYPSSCGTRPKASATCSRCSTSSISRALGHRWKYSRSTGPAPKCWRNRL